MLVFNPKKAIEIERKSALYEGLKRELMQVEQWTSRVSDISKYTADHMNTWIKYYEEESDELPVEMLNFRSNLPKESQWFDVRNNHSFKELVNYYFDVYEGNITYTKEAFNLLRFYGMVDANDERIYESERKDKNE